MPPLNRAGTLDESALKRLRRKQAQEKFDHVVVEGAIIENVLGFTYVGTNLEADGRSEQDVKIMMALARKQFGLFMNIWQPEEVDLNWPEGCLVQGWSAVGARIWPHKLDSLKEGGELAAWMELAIEVPGSYQRSAGMTWWLHSKLGL